MTAEQRAYRHHGPGFVIRSAIRLRGLPLAGSEADDAALDIVVGSVPARLTSASGSACARNAVLQADGARRVLLDLPYTARFLIEDGRRVTVDALLSLESPNLAALLEGPVLALVAYQRDLLVFNAVAVESTAGAVLLCAPHGGGKSSLALGLRDAGRRVLADGVAVLDAHGRLLPLGGALRIWPPSALALGHRPQQDADWFPDNDYRPRFLTFGGTFGDGIGLATMAPVPLRALLMLEPYRADETLPAVAAASGTDALMALSGALYARPMVALMGRQAALFGRLAGLAQTTPVLPFGQVFNFAALPDNVARLAALIHRLEADAA